MREINLQKKFKKVLQKDSIVCFEKLLEKLAKSKNDYWFRYYYNYKNLTDKQKWTHYYMLVVRRNDLKPKYKAKALDYLCKK